MSAIKTCVVIDKRAYEAMQEQLQRSRQLQQRSGDEQPDDEQPDDRHPTDRQPEREQPADGGGDDDDRCPEVERLLDFVPQQRRCGAKQCLRCLAVEGSIKFCPKTWEISVNDQRMQGSNLVDLLNHLLRPSISDNFSDKRREPVAWAEFQRVVSRSPLPVSLCQSQQQKERLCQLRKKFL